jgi:hypothetical protein
MEGFKLLVLFAILAYAWAQDTTVQAAPANTTQATQAPSGQTALGSNQNTAVALDCSQYTCTEEQINMPSPDNPLMVRSGVLKPPHCTGDNPPGQSLTCNYRDLKGTTVCYGVSCMQIDPDNGYCICPPDQIGLQCTTYKPGRCDSATGLLPSTSYSASNKRYRNRAKPDSGNIYARHFAASSNDCIRLCQWASPRCQSVNYGTLNGAQVCELLSVTVTEGSIMQPWLVDAEGWTYATVTGKVAAV